MAESEGRPLNIETPPAEGEGAPFNSKSSPSSESRRKFREGLSPRGQKFLEDIEEIFGLDKESQDALRRLTSLVEKEAERGGKEYVGAPIEEVKNVLKKHNDRIDEALGKTMESGKEEHPSKETDSVPPSEPPDGNGGNGDEDEEEGKWEDAVDSLGLNLTLKPLRDILRKYARLSDEMIQPKSLIRDMERIAGVVSKGKDEDGEIKRAAIFLKDKLGKIPKEGRDLILWDRFEKYAGQQGLEKAEDETIYKERLEHWFRRWVYNHLRTVIGDNPQNSINGLSQVRILLPGDIIATPLRDLLDEFSDEHKTFAEKIADEVRVISTVHNRNRLYQSQRVKGDLSAMAEALAGMSEYGAGEGQAIRLDGEHWQTLAKMGQVKERGEAFSEMLRRALRVYLGMKRDVKDGSLTRDKIKNLGLDNEGLEVYLQDQREEEGERDRKWRKEEYEKDGVLIRNPFPIQTKEKERERRETRGRIVALAGNGDEEMGRLAELLAFDMIEVGFIGADLDVKLSAIEPPVKVLHTAHYRDKYVRKVHEAGNPLTIPCFWKLCDTYFDAVKIRGKSLKEWFCDQAVESMASIPFQDFPAEMDDKFYGNQFNWAAKVFDTLVKGTQIPWPTLGLRGLEYRGVQVDPEHPTTLREIYKYLGYWADSVDIETLRLFDPREESVVSWAFYWLKQAEEGGEKFTESDLRLVVKNQAIREIVRAELMLHGKLNPSTRVKESILGASGRARITITDQDLVMNCLTQTQFTEGFSTEGLIWEGVEPVRIWTKSDVYDLFKETGITTPQAIFVNMQDILEQVSDIFARRKRR